MDLIGYEYSLVSSHLLVSWTTFSPDSMRSICLSLSFSMALAMALNEFRFLVSVRVPNSSEPTSLIERLTSARMDPSFSLQSEAPRYCIVSLSFSRYAITSSADLMSGSDTISISGTPERLKSTSELSVYGSWTSLPASSSICISWILTYFLTPSTSIIPAYWIVEL